jgi:hypothetical protein
MLRTVESLTVIPEKFVSLPKDVGNMTSLQGLLFQETMLFVVLKHPLQILQNGTWRGTPNLCNGQCHPGEIALQPSRWGMSI